MVDALKVDAKDRREWDGHHHAGDAPDGAIDEDGEQDGDGLQVGRVAEEIGLEDVLPSVRRSVAIRGHQRQAVDPEAGSGPWLGAH